MDKNFVGREADRPLSAWHYVMYWQPTDYRPQLSILPNWAMRQRQSPGLRFQLCELIKLFYFLRFSKAYTF